MGSKKVVEKPAEICEKEGGIVGAESKPVNDGTKRPKSSSKSGKIIWQINT